MKKFYIRTESNRLLSDSLPVMIVDVLTKFVWLCSRNGLTRIENLNTDKVFRNILHTFSP